jgi:hypothetical protein
VWVGLGRFAIASGGVDEMRSRTGFWICVSVLELRSVGAMTDSMPTVIYKNFRFQLREFPVKVESLLHYSIVCQHS